MNSVFLKGLLNLAIIFSTNCLLAQSEIADNRKSNTTTSETKSSLSLERVFRDPTLYPKPGNFGEFAPEGKHFLEFVSEETDKSKPTSVPQWSLVKTDIEGKSSERITLFDSK